MYESGSKTVSGIQRGNERMREHFNKFLTAMLLSAAMISAASPALAAETEPAVDTIVIEQETAWDGEIPADLSWKTKQDKGKWIDELGIAEDVNSLILVINNLDKADPEAIPEQGEDIQKEKKKEWAGLRRINGKSRFSYFSKSSDEEWQEVFSVDCYISGGESLDNEAIYGIYTPQSTFGIKDNPGSLLPFQKVTSEDYWFSDPENENYGSIYRNELPKTKPEGAVNLEGMKAFSNFGMIIMSEEDSEIPALIINCQQSDRNDDTLGGIQMPETYIRMLIQSIDEDTRIIIAGSLEELGEM